MKRHLALGLALLCLGTAGAATGGWQYNDAQYGFHLRLPGPWKQVPYRRGRVAFKAPDNQVAVGVQVRPESLQHYQVSLANFQHVASTMPNLLQKARIEKGTTGQGHPFDYIEVIEMNPEHGVPMVLAMSHVWLKAHNVTVKTAFQGKLTVTGNQLSRAQVNAMEAEAHAICLSVDGR